MRFHETNKMARRLEVGGWNYLTSHDMEEVKERKKRRVFLVLRNPYLAQDRRGCCGVKRLERVLRGEDIGEGAVGVDGEGAAAREGSEVGGGGAEKI